MTVESPQNGSVASSTGEPWWRSAVIYQVYIRSFADGNGDGIGDIAGIRARLPYLVELGVDASWINPWYPSPMADAGYDVADYRDIEPRFGVLADAEALLARGARGGAARCCSTSSPTTPPTSTRGSRRRWPRGPARPRGSATSSGPGAVPDGDQPPNDWRSVFGGPAWTRVTEPDGAPGEWYLHLFAPEQPDLNWDQPRGPGRVRARSLRFWFDRGVDGFRIDVAHALVKADGLPDLDGRTDRVPGPADRGRRPHPHWDRDEVHEIYRAWRRGGRLLRRPRVFVAEAWVARPERLAPLRPARRSCTPPSTSTSSGLRGTPRRCGRRSIRRWPSTRPSARRRPGCCPTTT